MATRISVKHKPGAMRLDGFPLLVYSGKRFGPGVRLAADPTVTVADVLAEVKAGRTPEQVARGRGLVVRAGTPDEAPNVAAIEQAVEYARQVGAFGA